MVSEHNEEEIAKQIAEDELARKEKEFESLAKPPKATPDELREDEGYEPPFRREERRGKPGRFQFGAGDTKPIGQLLMAVGISVLLSFLIISQFMVSKSDFGTNLNAMNATVSAAVNDMNQKVNAMNATVSGLTGTISNQVSNQVSQETAGITNQLTTISGQITELTDKISSNESTLEANQVDLEALLTQVATLEDKVAELETTATSTTTGDGTTTSYEGVVVEVSTLANMGIRFDGFTEGEEEVGTVKVRITNNTGYDIEEIELLAIYASNMEIDNILPDYPKLSGTLTWNLVQHYGNMFAFSTGWGGYGSLSIKKGKSKTLYPTLKIAVSATTDTQYFFGEPEFTCEGYDIAD